MSDCERLSDRMPEVAMQQSAWTAEEASHLGTCADCRAEWDLVLAAQRLEARAPTVDPAAIAERLQRRLTSEPASGPRHRWAWAAGAAAAAAAIVLAVTGGGESQRASAPAAAVAEAEPLVPLPELEGLETAQLDTLLRALDGPLAGGPDSTTLDNDVDAELEQILATWEG